MKKLLPIFLIFCSLVLQFFSSSVSQAHANELYFLHQDHLGSTRVVTDKQGNKVAEFSYYPYGSLFNETMKQSNHETIERRYTSQIYDQASDLYFYNARYYNPNIGAFISADPVQGPNRYAYVGSNPVNLTDPSGNSTPVRVPRKTPTGQGSGGGGGGVGGYSEGGFNLAQAMFGSSERWLQNVCGGNVACMAQHALSSIAYGSVGWDPLSVLTHEEKAELDVGMAVVGLVNPFSSVPTYISSGGKRVLISEAKDPFLRRALRKGVEWATRHRVNRSISRVDLVAEYTFSLPAGSKAQQMIYDASKGQAWLGQFFSEGGTAVCREKGLFAHLLLGKLGKESQVAVGVIEYVDKLGRLQRGRHAWLELTDTLRGQVVMDPALYGKVFDLAEYYQMHNISGGVQHFNFLGK